MSDYENWKAGTKLRCIDTTGVSGDDVLIEGQVYTAISDPFIDKNCNRVINIYGRETPAYLFRFEEVASADDQHNATITIKDHVGDIVNSCAKDMKDFFIVNKSIIYWIAIMVVTDHFLFEGKFREKLNEIVNALINKIKAKVDSIKI